MSFINITTHNCIISIRVFKKQRPKMCDKLTSRGASRESHNLQFKENFTWSCCFIDRIKSGFKTFFLCVQSFYSCRYIFSFQLQQYCGLKDLP